MTISDAFFILAQATPAPGQRGQTPFDPTVIVYMVVFGVIFYVLMIRVPRKQKQEQQALINSAKTGDKIITSAGIHGMITNVKETTVILKVDDNVKIEVEKSSISTVVKRKEEAAA